MEYLKNFVKQSPLLFSAYKSFSDFYRRLCVWMKIDKYLRPGLNDLDNKLSKYIGYKDGYFIEVGANDGYSQSNTFYLEKVLGWEGLLVEPIPELYSQCRKERKKSSVYNFALVSSEFSEKEILIDYAGLQSVVVGAMGGEELRLGHIEKGLSSQNIKSGYSVSVPTITLEALLQRESFREQNEIDFFSLDVEGYEVEVLKGLNLDKYRPKYILVETRQFEIVERMLRKYYLLKEKMSYHDYLFVRS